MNNLPPYSREVVLFDGGDNPPTHGGVAMPESPFNFRTITVSVKMYHTNGITHLFTREIETRGIANGTRVLVGGYSRQDDFANAWFDMGVSTLVFFCSFNPEVWTKSEVVSVIGKY